MFCKEVITWKALRHQNVLPLLGVTMSRGQFAMVSEWMTNGNINEFIEKRMDANRFELVKFQTLLLTSLIINCLWSLQLKDVAEGLIYMHGEGMIHGDLKGVGLGILTLFGLLTFLFIFILQRPTS
jgi:serine/threonine protein kinase